MIICKKCYGQVFFSGAKSFCFCGVDFAKNKDLRGELIKK